MLWLSQKLNTAQLRGFAYLCEQSGMSRVSEWCVSKPPRKIVAELHALGLLEDNRRNLTWLGYAVQYRVFGPRCEQCDDCLEWQMARQDAAACLPKALEFASYCGAEYAANPGSDRSEYSLDMALRAGYATWNDVPVYEKKKLLASFREGQRKEDAHVR